MRAGVGERRCLAMDINRVDIFGPGTVEVTLSNGKITVDVDGRNVLRVVRIGRLAVEDQRARTEASNRHFFACVKKGYDNLPEGWAKLIKSSEQLRKFALIKAGYADVRTIALPTEEAANQVAAVVRSVDPFSVVSVHETMVTAASAKSQSAQAMDRDEFRASKDAVLEVIASMVGVSVDELSSNAGAAA